jgi:hypothetical protein
MTKLDDFPGQTLPTTTVHQSRLQVYQPTRRPVLMTQEIKTPWGIAQIKGKLGQGHADLLEAMFNEAIDYKFTGPAGETDQLQLLIDPYKISTSMGGGEQYSYSSIDKMCDDLMSAIVYLEPIDGNIERIRGHIIEKIEESKATRRNPLTGGQRKLWRVTISDSWMKFIWGDMHLHYDPKPIAKLTTGIAQAVARHVATHRQQPPGGWHIDGLILAVGGGKNTRQLQNQRADIKADREGLEKLGISLENGRLKRSD